MKCPPNQGRSPKETVKATTSIVNRQARISPDHIDLAHRLGDPACALPAFGKERDRAGPDLDDLARAVSVGATSRQKMAELVARHRADPGARRADPDARLRAAVAALVEHHPRGARRPLDHRRDDPPIV